MQKIPKVIHYCWFGGNSLSDMELKCIASWKEKLPDYEIKEWNERNFDVSCNSYVQEAYNAKKWAFVSDYVRLYALYSEGGIYMDTDVELVRNIDNFLEHRAFAGFEDQEHISTAIMGGVKANKWFELLLSYYDNKHFIKADGKFDLTTNVKIITNMTKVAYDINLDNTLQIVNGELAFYPNEYFSPKEWGSERVYITSNTYTIHHYNHSWCAFEDNLRFSIKRKLKKIFGIRISEDINIGINILIKHGIKAFVIKLFEYLITKLYERIPLQNIILFESLGDLDSNSGAFFEYMIENGLNEKYKMYWLVREPEKFKNVKIKNVGFMKIYHYNIIDLLRIYTAKYLIWDAKEIAKVRNDQKSIYLTHGGPDLKNCRGITNPSKQVDFVLCPSEQVIDKCCYQYSLTAEKMIIFGHPRNDLLFFQSDEIKKLVNERIFKNILIWMPTFRKFKFSDRNDSDKVFKLGIPLINDEREFAELNNFLEVKNTLLIIKIHPGQDLSNIPMINHSNILILTNEKLREMNIKLYSLIGETDALITDYSSVAFDYLLLDKPLGYIIDDINEYKLGFTRDNPLDFMPGKKIKTLKEFKDFIGDIDQGYDIYGEEREKMRNFANKYQDNQNCRRLLEYFNL